jgi:hypothetical protein
LQARILSHDRDPQRRSTIAKERNSMSSLLLQGKRAVVFGAGGTMGVRMVTGTVVNATAGSGMD